MGKIYYLMGKSASGKDTIYKRLHVMLPELKTVRIYTTRPIRDGERDGEEYFFVTREYLEECREQGSLIECRTYDTIYGPWDYFTVNDGQIQLDTSSYLVMGTLESYGKMRSYYGADALVPVYIHVEDGLRLRRAMEREEQQNVPKYKEMCRRFLADEEDFKQENLDRYGIVRQYENAALEECLEEIIRDMKSNGLICAGGPDYY